MTAADAAREIVIVTRAHMVVSSERQQVGRVKTRLFVDPEDRENLWRRRVERLSRELKTISQYRYRDLLTLRRCDNCGEETSVNSRVFLSGEPLPCCDGVRKLYDPTVARDGYWFACALDGKDPDAVDAAMPPSSARLVELLDVLKAEGFV